MVNARKSMVLEIFQLSISDETHLKETIETAGNIIGNSFILEFLSPQQVIFAGNFLDTESRTRDQISQRISRNIRQGQVSPLVAG